MTKTRKQKKKKKKKEKKIRIYIRRNFFSFCSWHLIGQALEKGNILEDSEKPSCYCPKMECQASK